MGSSHCLTPFANLISLLRLFPAVHDTNVAAGKCLINRCMINLYLYCQLCDDLFTFRTELKKVVISVAKASYDIFPKGTMARKDEVKKCVIAKATKLLKTGDYLRVPDSSNVWLLVYASQGSHSLLVL